MKRTRKSRKNREFIQTLIFFLTTIISISGLVAYLWVYTEIDETMLTIEIQNQVVHELSNSVKELEMEISNLSRGDRISKVAKMQLGMIPAQPETLLIYVSSNKIALQVD